MEIKNFKIIKSLGMGATAEVFEAINITNDETVALKVFNPIIFNDKDAMTRLNSEVELLARLRHPNIVALLSRPYDSNAYSFELELVKGSDLRKWSAEYGLDLLEPSLWLLSQVAQGLGAAHELEVLHRDLKPENILISDAGEVKITDFGLARQLDRLTVTRMGLLMGSLGYMAPEVINGEKASHKSDVFSFGVIAYEILGRKFPFNGETPQALLKSVCDGDEIPLRDVNPAVPARVSGLISRCLKKNPADRPETIWTVEAEIMTYLSGTRLLPFCRQLVAKDSREMTLGRALGQKHKALKNQITVLADESKKSDSPEKRRAMIAAIGELKRFFPDDPSSNEWMGELARGQREGRRWYRTGIIFFIFLFCASGFYLTRPVRSALEKTDIKEASPTAADGAVVPPAPLIVASPVKESVVAAPLAPIPPKKQVPKARKIVAETMLQSDDLLGTIKFEADDDVAVFVNEQYVPPAQWNAYKTSPGLKKIRLVKNGYLPIENTLKVTADQTTVVNAKGAP